jgi:hypothetical protein
MLLTPMSAALPSLKVDRDGAQGRSVVHMTKAKRVLRAVAQWPVESQLHARRNALVASTALTQRRRETLEVAAYLESCRARHGARTGRTTATG